MLVSPPQDALTLTLDHSSLSVDLEWLHPHILSICTEEEKGILELSIIFTSSSVVHLLNKEHLGHDYDTDVIAFPYHSENSPSSIDGEIYINLDIALERCEEFNSTYVEESARYAIHGLLHLIGYNDKTPEQQKVMRDKEVYYLDRLFNRNKVATK